MASIARDIIDSIFNPTTKPQAGVIKVMNASFYALFLTLLGLAYVTSWNLHVLALTAVAVLLYASISWFIIELGKVQDAQKAEPAGGSSAGEMDSAATLPAKRSQHVDSASSSALKVADPADLKRTTKPPIVAQ